MKKSNREFADQDIAFRTACELAGLRPTSRQASKYRRRRGLAARFAAQVKR